MDTVIQKIIARQSRPRLVAPAPSKDQINQILRCALRAPDHGRLKPWRFIVLEGDALVKLGEAFLATKTAELGELTDSQRDKFTKMPTRAPMIIVAIADIKEHPKVPPIEQVVAVGCAVQNMQLAIDSLGFGAMWRTGEFAFNIDLKHYFGASEKDEIVGYLYVGTPEGSLKEIEEQLLSSAVEFWA